MTRHRPSPYELMRMHVDALYVHDTRGRLLAVNQWDGGLVPRFFLGRTAAGHVARCRADLDDRIARALEDLARTEPSGGPVARVPAHYDEYLRLLESNAPISRLWTGPAYWIASLPAGAVQTVSIDEGNADLLRGRFDDWLPDVPHRRPFEAVVVDGRAVSLCASVRITADAHAAGVETSPQHRKQGFASRAVVGWATAVRRLGAVPLYSTSWDNDASQRVAAGLAMSMFGVDFHVT